MLKKGGRQLPKVAFYTLGCKVNQYDSEAMAALFRQRGYEVVPYDEIADVYVINTCTVTHQGDAKSRKLIRRAKRQNGEAVIVVAGCYAQTSPGEVRSIPGVDVVLGNNHRDAVVDLAEAARTQDEPLCQVENLFRVQGAAQYQELSIDSFHGRTRAVIKVQDGCTEFCTYCIIPYARGMLRSRRPGAIVSEVRRLVAQGFKEIVLAGIHMGAYGKDFHENIGLVDLLNELMGIDGLERVRLSSIEPMDVDFKLLELMASNAKLCRHLHLPLQSGSDQVLARMKRRYTTDQFRSLVVYARQLMPDIAITTDIMVGFPGETEEQHAESLNFVAEMGFSRLHVFPYSPRHGTPAASFPEQVDPAVQRRRVKEFLKLGEEMAMAYHSRFLGKTLNVLVEKELDGDTGLCQGYTDNYIRVVFDPGVAGLDGQTLGGHFVAVRIDKVGADGAHGTVVRSLGAAGSVPQRVDG